MERPPSAHAGTQARTPPAEMVAGQKQHQSSDEIKDLEILHPSPAACILPMCFGEAGKRRHLQCPVMFPEGFVLSGSLPTGVCTGHLDGQVISNVLFLPNSGGHVLKKEVFSPPVFFWEH